MANFEDLTNKKFNMLLVLEKSESHIEPSGRKRTMWKCRCDCGNIKVIPANCLKSGTIKSCGCLKTKRNKNYFTTHNGSKERLYQVWCDIKKRCYNSNFKQFKDYGGRGIKVCDEWLNDYDTFRKWAFDNGYEPKAKFGDCTIDRINVNGNYSPENCRFVSMKVQNNNKRRK